MQRFTTKKQLIEAFVNAMLRRETGWDKASATTLARMTVRHDPTKYRGGHVIPGFGYSTEFVGKVIRKVTAENAGNPAEVRA